MKTFIKIIVCICSFIAALFLFGMVFNRGNTDMTVEMQPARYPLLSVLINEQKINCLHPYVSEPQLPYMRENITPLVEGRGLSVCIDTFGNEIGSIMYEIRDLTGERLVEQTELTGYMIHENKVTTTFSVKNLIEEEKEYQMIFFVTLADGVTLRYYTRLIQAYDYNAPDKLAFAFDFSEKTFLRDDSSKDLVVYLESDATDDDSNYHKVDIHSSYQQILWGDLAITRVTEPVATILELSKQTASIELNYIVNVPEGRKDCMYAVKEYFRMRIGSERMYLLEYERDMSRLLFTADKTVFGEKIMLGITDEEIALTESADGNQLAFVNMGTLYSYNITSNSFAKVFGFYDENNFDERTLYDAHDIKILNIDEAGNLSFMVYGYMNRGKHEGEVGIAVYRYDGVINTTEEVLFLPYDKSPAMLKANVARLSYLNATGDLFVYLDGTVFCVNLKSLQQSVIAENLTDQTFKASDNNVMIAWQKGNDAFDSEKLLWMNLNTKESNDVNAGEGARIRPLGFLDEDLIYGLAYETDIYTDETGNRVFPMYTIRIRNNEGSILKNYEQENLYVISCTIQENMISLTRITRNEETLRFEEAPADAILNNEIIKIGANLTETVVTQNLKKIVQIALKRASEIKTVKELFPREVMYEGNRSLKLDIMMRAEENYYVYNRGEIIGVYNDPAMAIHLAEERVAVVIGDNGDYIWRKGNRKNKNTISAIAAQTQTETKGALSVCLDAMLNYEGITRNTQPMVTGGRSVTDILELGMPEATILNLTGCSLDSVLYYPDRDIPVLVMMEDGSALLLIGFNELNTVVMDPVEGTIHKIGINDSTELFEKNGNRYITYLPQK